ncbi:hypothetical protein [Streptomyces sp. SID3212]|uniref:hypothetical protein n=1 Tax=Streptomyces sp. SID3212 TaxID=2690259 RepID=UPI001370ECEF|nr:hypothetical protein [Streptomyces sp. SID3212]MYV51853.1 hypothetical protein [Streptomyces sp. SID3212]
MSSTGNSDSGDSGGTSARAPWWRGPALLAALAAIGVAVVTGWVQRGEEAVVSAMSEDDPNRPVVAVGANDEVFCSTWLLHKDPSFVGQNLRNDLRGVDVFGKELRPVLERTKDSTGSQLPTGNRVDVTIVGKREQVVVLEGIELSVAKKSSLGDLMGVGDQCGGGFPARFFEVDLDVPNPEFKVSDVDDNGKSISEPIDFPYQVSSSEPEKFILMGKAKRAVEWTATLRWVADGKSGKTEIDDHGKPFVSFPEADVRYHFNTSTKELSIDQ